MQENYAKISKIKQLEVIGARWATMDHFGGAAQPHHGAGRRGTSSATSPIHGKFSERCSVVQLKGVGRSFCCWRRCLVHAAAPLSE